jgi:hypothetical protein
VFEALVVVALYSTCRQERGNLHSYAGRAADRLKRTGSPEFLLRGLAAVSIDNDRSFQNFGIVLGELYRNATEHGLDASSWEFRCRDRFALDSLHHHRVRLAPGAGPSALRALNRSRQPPPCHPPSFIERVGAELHLAHGQPLLR